MPYTNEDSIHLRSLLPALKKLTLKQLHEEIRKSNKANTIQNFQKLNKRDTIILMMNKKHNEKFDHLHPPYANILVSSKELEDFIAGKKPEPKPKPPKPEPKPKEPKPPKPTAPPKVDGRTTRVQVKSEKTLATEARYLAKHGKPKPPKKRKTDKLILTYDEKRILQSRLFNAINKVVSWMGKQDDDFTGRDLRIELEKRINRRTIILRWPSTKILTVPTTKKIIVIIEKLIKVAIEKTMDDDYEIDTEDGVDRAEREMEERGDDPYETEYPPGTFITGTFEDQPDGRGVVVPSKFEEDLREVFNIKNFV